MKQQEDEIFPHMGYVEVNLKISEIKAFNEEILMLVIEDSLYAQHIPNTTGNIAHWQGYGFDKWKRNNSTLHKMETK